MDIQKLMQQAQKMQSDLTKIQEELEQTEYTGNSGGVSVTINGRNEVQSVNIAEELMSTDNREMLQDMLLIAMNEAVRKAAEDRETKVGNAAGGFRLPGM